MALVSSPLCHSATGDAVSAEGPLNKKRASIHYPEDSTAAKRLSLHFGHRCRSLSESWAFTSTAAVVPESQEKKGTISIISPSPLSASTSASLSATPNDTTEKDEEMDQALLKTLTSFLQSQGQSTRDNSMDIKDRNPKDRLSTTSTWDDKTTTDSGFFPSAGPSDSELTICDLVVSVRDFAYATSHPFHRGQYPPEPVYKESDIEEDYDEDFDTFGENNGEDEEGEEDRTHGQARGLYDFDAENESELSFKEGDFLWIHYRQFPGWFLGEMEGKSGLVPENYVQLL
ncbi:HOG (high osmolarity glycerol) pathway protein [Mortierella sp. GBA35]|nr:HOG (high osmolarity glycerol) pathway protein [Mortierella sp. GBA35]